MDKRWKILSADPETCDSLHEALKINPVLCKILVQRGITTYNEAKRFFRPQTDMLYDPWLMKDMDKAVNRIMQAITYNEKILVFGDYDVDGTSSVACMTKFLREVYKPGNIEFYIPHRYREGYGISKAGIDFAYKENYSLIISLDCGIKSIDLISYARNLGIDFIVCDHHLPDNELPPAVAILNPKQKDCPYPFKDLCGCGVGYKLICALAKTLGLSDDYPLKYLDLVATAIAADIVSMTDENRVLVFYGLKKANTNPNPGIKALMHLSGIKTEMLIGNLVFMIAPRVNAAGRMDDARKAVQMFISDNYHQALQYAEMLHSDNTDRREADRTITEEALKLINDNEGWASRKSTVVYQSHWHKGVVGIVASRLIDHFYRPTIVLTQSGEYVAGSARSVSGFNVYEAIHQCKDLLLGYGGHFYAAGMTMSAENVAPFQHRFEEVVSSIITDDLLVPEIIIDAEVKLKDLSNSFYNIISQMEPFGPDNPKPVLLVRNVTDTGFSKVVKELHLRVVVTQDNIVFSGIGFNLAEKYKLLEGKQPVDVVFTLDVNEWNGSRNLQLKVIDVRREA
ncbi:MAG: single-stranded-DNA-specific exonuclease RecJ [Chitinophagaceae bacterium]|nr:single-stranded-DNA-specific exonuclease RecJ [Chitinophagaceae bacterium]